MILTRISTVELKRQARKKASGMSDRHEEGFISSARLGGCRENTGISTEIGGRGNLGKCFLGERFVDRWLGVDIERAKD